VVIRINRTGDICNARPCHNCLNMMKAVGIRKVYYSTAPNELICENVKDMISIQSSSVSKIYEKNYGNKLVDDPIKYYENLIKKYFPSNIKKYNLDIFIKYNLTIFLPNYQVKVDKKNDLVWIINDKGYPIIQANFI
jgi:hypothetical protein